MLCVGSRSLATSLALCACTTTGKAAFEAGKLVRSTTSAPPMSCGFGHPLSHVHRMLHYSGLRMNSCLSWVSQQSEQPLARSAPMTLLLVVPTRRGPKHFWVGSQAAGLCHEVLRANFITVRLNTARSPVSRGCGCTFLVAVWIGHAVTGLHHCFDISQLPRFTASSQSASLASRTCQGSSSTVFGTCTGRMLSQT